MGLSGTEYAEETLIDVDPGYIAASKESIDKYMGDVIFMVDPTGNPTAEEFVASEYLQSLPAVENDLVFYMDPGTAIYADPISLAAQVDYLLGVFTNEIQ